MPILSLLTLDWDAPGAGQRHCQRRRTIHRIARIFISRVEPWCSPRRTTQYDLPRHVRMQVLFLPAMATPSDS